MESPEGIPTNILSDRLERLLDAKIVEQVPAADGSKRLAYQLTEKGLAIRPLLKAIRDWGLKWEPGTSANLERVRAMGDSGNRGRLMQQT